jgi:hypothetical protein
VTLAPRSWAIVAVVLGLGPTSADAGRPLVTDDAGTVGLHALQIESWARRDRNAFQHWLLVGFGVLAPLELSVGMVYGANTQGSATEPSIAGPIGQVKLLLDPPGDDDWGTALAVGVIPPVGRGGFESRGVDLFVYAALTRPLIGDDRLLVHLNLGGYTTADQARYPATFAWGLAAQSRLIGQLVVAAELFSGDAYASEVGGACQLALRYVFSERIQADATVGTGLWGDPALPVWFTAGIRVFTGSLW